jgi:hypothetical protein
MLAHLVEELPSVALDASKPAPSTELATVVLPRARLEPVEAELVVAVAV